MDDLRSGVFICSTKLKGNIALYPHFFSFQLSSNYFSRSFGHLGRKICMKCAVCVASVVYNRAKICVYVKVIDRIPTNLEFSIQFLDVIGSSCHNQLNFFSSKYYALLEV